MKSLLPKSRPLQICVVAASLVFVLGLSSTMWLDAYQQRNMVRVFEGANEQEESIFTLGSALANERRLVYTLLSSNDINPSGLEELRFLSGETDAFATRNEAIFKAMEIAAQQIDDRHHSHDHHGNHGAGLAPTPAANDTGEMPLLNAQHSSSGIMGSSLTTKIPMPTDTATQEHTSATSEGRTVKQVIEQLRHHDVKLHNQLMLKSSQRQPMYGMMLFHEYSSAIDNIDELRYSLHKSTGQGLSEHYIITKLKDSFWRFGESVSQTSALLEGIAMMFENSQETAQTAHHADMLMELSVRVDISWNELVKTISSSSNAEIVEQTLKINDWYQSNFRLKSIELAAPSQFNTVSLPVLRDWLTSAQQLTTLTEDIRIKTNMMTSALIHSAEHRTTMSLIQVSVMVLFSLFMALATALFFRRVDKQAHQDELTGLDNRRMFSIALDRSLTGSETEAGILMVDLDKFKQINDTMGHAAGDRLLKEVSKRIVIAGAECSSISRLGGDEFAMLFRGRKTSEMENVAERVRQSLIDPFNIDGATLNIGSSIGIASYPQDAQTPDSLINAADLAMYCAKKSGTNQIAHYDSQVDQSMAMAAQTIHDLQVAIKNNELELYYQPQFNLAEAKVMSAEALIRWNHPERGFLTPNHFIPVAEENGLMTPIGNWVIDEACKQAAYWLYHLKMPLRVAVNISADHFFQPNFVQNIVDSLERHKLPPQLLEVEVTESVAMNDIKLVVESLKKLREMSVHVALDDFGTGYSSLSYLQELPLDTLKIDKSFIQNMLNGNSREECITETIVQLGKTLNLETVAEGVETMDQLTAVSDMRITIVQGFYYSKPVSARELEKVVKQLNNMDPQQKAA